MAIPTRLSFVGLALGFALASPAALSDQGSSVSPERYHQRDRDIKEGKVNPRVVVKDSPLDDYIAFKEVLRLNYGFDYTGQYTLMFQQGTQGGTRNSTANGQLNAILSWTLLRDEVLGTGGIEFRYLHLHQIGSVGGVAFTGSLGTASFPSDSIVDSAAVKHLYWNQSLFGSKAEIRVGYLPPTIGIDDSLYAGDDTNNFIAQVLSANPTRALNDIGFGVSGKAKVVDALWLTANLVDANGKSHSFRLDTLGRGQFLYGGSLTYKPKIAGWGQGVYQFSGYAIDATATTPRGWALVFNADQEIGKNWAAFLKINMAQGRQALVKKSLSFGVVRKGFLGYKSDVIGLGAAWVQPTASTQRNEYVIEAYWRMQLLRNIHLTPDVQVYINPARSPGRNLHAVFSIRLAILF